MPRGKTKNKEERLLPKYLKLAKGAMWSDDISGVKIYDRPKRDILIGRRTEMVPVVDTMTGKQKVNEYGLKEYNPIKTDIPKDKNKNEDTISFGSVEIDNLSWYIDTDKIPNEKLGRIILAYRHGILTEADPKNPPKDQEVSKDLFKANTDFGFSEKGDRIFVGKNNEMYLKLMNNKPSDLVSFINTSPNNEYGKRNLLDLLEYEKKGYNQLNRPRGEILDIIRAKLNEFGNFISPIRKNDI